MPRCPVCESAETFEFLRRAGVPVHQNLLLETADAARGLARGDLVMRLCAGCGFGYNAAFRPELLDYGRNRITALVVEEASQTSHIAIVARSLSIPLVGGVEGASDAARTGDRIVVDAETGEVHLRPPNEVIVAFQAKQALLAQRVARFAAIRGEPAVTRDGVRISLNMNAGLLLDLPHLAQSGADGIGLYV